MNSDTNIDILIHNLKGSIRNQRIILDEIYKIIKENNSIETSLITAMDSVMNDSIISWKSLLLNISKHPEPTKENDYD